MNAIIALVVVLLGTIAWGVWRAVEALDALASAERYE